MGVRTGHFLPDSIPEKLPKCQISTEIKRSYQLDIIAECYLEMCHNLHLNRFLFKRSLMKLSK